MPEGHRHRPHAERRRIHAPGKRAFRPGDRPPARPRPHDGMARGAAQRRQARLPPQAGPAQVGQAPQRGLVGGAQDDAGAVAHGGGAAGRGPGPEQVAGRMRLEGEPMAGRVAIIDANPRRDAALKARLAGEALAQRRAGHVRHDRVRCRQRPSEERVNSALKDSCGGRHVRFRGNLKVACHLFFGVLALTVDRLMRLTI